MRNHLIHLRWADIDQLDHVTNVRYLDYADEARVALVEAGDLRRDVQIGQCAVDYLRPLPLSMTPVHVSGQLDGDELSQEIFADEAGQRAVYARVVTTLVDSRQPIVPDPVLAGSDPIHLRRSDTTNGIVSNAKYFELFQEARVLVMEKLIEISSTGAFVMGRMAIDYADDLQWRPEPYPARTWVEKYGRSSIHLCSEILNGDRVVARSAGILVGFDASTQRSRPLGEAERAFLEESLRKQG